jgi:hypothetical protein
MIHIVVLILFLGLCICISFIVQKNEKITKLFNRNKRLARTVNSTRVPDWFTGVIYQNGKYCENLETKKGIYLNNIEASMYDVANGSLLSILTLQNKEIGGDKLFQQMKLVDPFVTREGAIAVCQIDLDLTSDWLEEYNFKAYQILIEGLNLDYLKKHLFIKLNIEGVPAEDAWNNVPKF